jgi:ADP-dependent NAD(P)H-hydrate dehydratase / NAD(P)H-hydrate epimerase
MTKVVSGKEMTRIEQLSLESKKYLSKKYMENAGKGVADFILGKFAKSLSVLLLCGKGNNSGDAYVAGCYLLESGFKVKSYKISADPESSLCLLNHNRFKKQGGESLLSLDSLDSYDLILDGILGTGFKGNLDPVTSEVFKKVNAASAAVVAIDVPSGIDANCGLEKSQIAIKADYTLTLGFPKTGIFLQTSPSYVGSLKCLDFGLNKKYLELACCEYILISKDNLPKVCPQDLRQHKYSAGLVTALAGSAGMLGAARLSSKAAYRSGCGVVKLLLEEKICKKFQSYPELITLAWSLLEQEKIVDTLNKGKSCYIGPGLGQGLQIRTILKNTVPKITVPLVLDADGLNIFSQDRFNLPRNTILTPHLGEAAKLLQQKEFVVNRENLEKIKNFARENSVYIILKGYPNFIFSPEGKSYIISAGDPGMATAGSGDVLTGVVSSLLAQGYNHLDACLLGVWLHASAGEIAAQKQGSHSLMASDITASLAEAFKKII